MKTVSISQAAILALNWVKLRIHSFCLWVLLNVNKAHGHDDISITMLKICDSELTEPLSIIFKNYWS